MEGQKRPRVFQLKRYNTQKRFLALMLAFAMIFTSVGADLNVAYAAEGNRVDFEIYGADLVEAINDAVETQSPVTADDLNFTNGAIEKFDALFFGEGKVYEVFPAVEGGDMDAEVRVFVRLPEDADDMYMVTGDEEVIFLYINNGEDTISCSTKIIRTVDGEEKVKSTKRITVKSYEDKFGEEESNIISKPEETLPAVPETSAPESQPEETPAETLTPAETTAPEETTVPEETEAPDATEESSETEETTEAPESTEVQETETSEETKEETTEAETEATEAEKEETEAVEETEEPETEADEEKSQDDSAVTLSSISRHQVPVVAVKEDAEQIETEEVSETEAEEETEKETEAETEETEAEETEKETTAAPEKETTAAEETTSQETTAAPEESTEATEETSTEAESSEEVTESEEATTAPETQETEETTEAETEAPAETETTAPAETETQAPVQPATPAEPEEGNKPAATDTDLVGMGWCSTAKAYTRTLNELRALEDIPGYKVTYAINPEYSARIVDGPRGVEEGETLVFGVKNQIGYAVESVVVNGEVIEADTTEDNEDGSKTVWYSVPEVMGEMDVEVVMTENGNHPAVTLDPIEVDGVTIQISAEEGVLPEGVTATAARVNQDVEATVADRMTEDGKAISSVMAFDINLWLGDQLLDSEIWGGSQKVTVTFSGQPIEENAAAADTVETVYVETVYDGDKAAKEQVANEEIQVAATDVTNVIPVSDEIDTAEAGISAVSFEAEHFSIYALVGSTWYKNSYEMYQGQTIRLYAYDTWGANEGTWSVSSDNVQLGNHGYDRSKDDYYTDITAESATQSAVTVTYKYRGFHGTSKQTFSIRVNNGQKEETAYFYVLKPGKDAGSLLDESWLYVGKGKINASGLKNQNGNPMEAGQGHYSNDVDGRVISYPDESVIKQRIAESYGVSIKDVQIGYAPFKISYPNGWKDENDNGHDDTKPCYHVDMTVSITTKHQASVTYHLSDAGVTGYTVLGSYMVDKGSSVSVPSDISQQCPDKKGDYYFDGWYTNPERTGDKVVFPYLVNEGTDFYAKYVYSPEITIRYEAVGGGSVTAASETVRVTDPESAVNGSAAVETSGYVFKGWYDNQAGNGSPLSVDRSFKPVKSPLGWEAATYYAVFTKIEQTKITGPYVEIKDNKPNDKLYYQGEVNVEVYLDGTPVVENSDTVKFGYEQYACVDLSLTYLQSDKTVVNAVYAIQVEGKTKPKPITENLVDNVKDGSTVYIYLSSVYGVNYVVNGDVVGIEVPADNNKYTIPSNSKPSGKGYSEWEKDLSSYKTENVTIEALPVKSGVTFSDWKDTEKQTHAAGSNWSLSNAIRTANKDNNVITLTTTPTDNTYTVHYQTNGGSAVADKVVGWDEANLGEATSRTGYNFAGWYTDKDLTKAYEDTMTYGDVAESDSVETITLYAKWTAKSVDYTVSFFYQNSKSGEFDLYGKPERRSAKTDESVEVTNSDKTPKIDLEHYLLDETQSVLKGTVAADGSTELKVYFKLQYTVTFYEMPNGKVLKTETVDWNKPATAPENPSRPGYTFGDWDKNFDNITKDTDVYAKWIPDISTYKVEYYYQNPVTEKFEIQDTVEREGKTGLLVTVTDNDKIPSQDMGSNYVLDEEQDDWWSKQITADGNTVLKVYFKLQFTVNFWLTIEETELLNTQIVDLNGDAIAPSAPSMTGYTFDGWDFGYTNIKADTNVHARWKENDQKYTVQYIDEDTNEGLEAQRVKDAKYGQYITGADEAIDIKDYVFTRATDLTVSENNESNYVFVYYSKDANGDKVPDKYQRKVTFNVVNGAWNDGETAQKETWVTLTDEAGNWSEDGSHTLVHEDIPAAGKKPDTGYKAGIWKAHPENQVITRDSDNVEYTYSYVPDENQTKEITYDVKHVRVSEDGTEEVFAMETVPQRIWVNTFPEDLNVWDITLRNGDGWTYDRNENHGGTVDPLKADADRGYLVGEGTVLNGREIIVYYVKDENGDNIPDKYQRRVTFNVVNGAWDDGETAQKEIWVTLTDEAGNWAEDGSYTLISKDIPEVGEEPDNGYMAGIWKVHPENQVITRDSDNVEYTYSYVPDETKTKELTYDVKHVRVSEDGTEEVFAMETVPQRIWINTFPEDLNVWDITLKNGNGWTYDRNENPGGTVDPLKADADRGYLVGEGTVLNGREITVYYVKDENGDNIPDKYQRKVTFNVVNGAWNDGETAQKEIWVTLTDEAGNWAEDGSYTLISKDIPEVGEEPDNGYMAGIWKVHPENQVITRDSDNVEYTYSYVPDETKTKELSYIVNHIKINSDGTESLIDSEKVTEKVWVNLGQTDLAVQDIMLKAENGYAYERNDAPEGTSFKLDESLTKLTGEGRIADQGVVNVYYSEDGNGDDIPDKHQIIFTYVSAGNGTVEGKTTEVHTFTDGEGNYTEPKEASPEANVTITPAEGYAFDFWDDTEGNDFTPDMANLKQKTYGTDTTFTVHFDKDEIGTDPTDPNKPDNVPDNRQITFRYVSENPSYGTVSGTVVEVRTIMEVVEGEKGYQVLETKSVNPFADVTVSANGRYRFERWSDGTTNFANADEISAASFNADTTFTAYFDYNGGGSSGGGGDGGNGGGPSGSGGDSSRGPGVTVTIDNPDVPLAPAPETGTGDVISINDGMVPMAPLPKTGQTTMRSTLLMAFSGILLAITGFSKKRKEEEN